MRILHTSDWHLGHTLRDLPRDHEHERFLAWLLDTIRAQRVGALLVAGDVFHTANPPASAQALWYRFLAEARRRFPKISIVVIGGNHDSAARLDAPVPLLEEMRIHVFGGVPRTADGRIDAERMVVPLFDPTGHVAGWVAAVPYLRRADLPAIEEDVADPLVEGVRRVYASVFEAARRKRWPGHALLAMGHFTMTGTAVSELSERQIVVGGQHALPADVFPESLAYVALGHLHLAQSVARPNIRYSGSPIPLSMAEADYPHQAVLVEIDGERFVSATPLAVPRTVDLLRLPEAGPLGIDEVLMRLRAIEPARPGTPAPYLEVQVRVDRPDAGLRRRVEEVLEGRHARLVQITTHKSSGEEALGDAVPDRHLRDLDPIDVFSLRYAKEHGGEPPIDLLEAFHELLEAVRAEAAA